MKRTLSLLLGLSLFGAASVVAQEAKKDAPKKDAAPAVKLAPQQPDVAAPKFDPKTGQVQAGFAKSNSDARRLIEQGGVSLGDQKVSDVKAVIAEPCVLWAGKKRAMRVVFAG